MFKKPTVQQVEARIEALPQHLQEALFSVELTNLGADIGASNKVEDRLIPPLGDVIAWVLMGFLHPSGAAEVIQEYVGVNAGVAKNTAQELNAKIFSKYSSDLEKVYAPMAITPLPPGKPPAPKAMSISPAAPGSVNPTPAMQPPKAVTPPPAAKVPAQGPGVPVPPASSKPPASFPAPAPSSAPSPKSGGSPKPAPAAKPAPFILHQEAAATPLAAGRDFKLSVSSDMFRSPERKKVDVPMPPKAARLEIGKPPTPPKPQTASHAGSAAASRVVHYTDLRTAVSSPFGDAPPKASDGAKTPVGAPPKPARAPSPMPQPPQPKKDAAAKPPAPAPELPKAPAPPAPPKPPKVVNFGPEEVK